MDGSSDRDVYIETWKDVAIEQMHLYGIPASITLAQAILESGNGKSMLSVKANNHFGIKCHSWKGASVRKDDDKKNECFRKYKNAQESFEDHSAFLKKPRYAFLFDYKITDYKAWAKGLKKAGYATDPSYARRLIDLVEQNDLAKYDRAEMLASKDKSKPSSRPRFDKERPISKEDIEVIDITVSREVRMHPNAIKFVKAKSGDSIERIAESLDMAAWQIKRYNDLIGGHRFKGGETVYLQPKKNKSKTPYHMSAEGETLRDISQRYGVKLSRLKDYNSKKADVVLARNTKILLRKPKR